MAGRYTFRWIVPRLLVVGGCVLLAVQILNQLTFMSMKDAHMDCEQYMMFKQRTSEHLVNPVAMDKSEAESVREAVGTAIPEKAIRNLAQSLKQLAEELMETQRSLTYSAQHFTQLNLHVQSVNRILKTLQEAEVQNNNAFSPGIVYPKDSPQNKEVCPEKFMGENLAYGYPFFRKGFATLNCTDFVPIHKLVTLLIDIPQELPRPADDYLEILQGVGKYYPKVSVILRTENAIENSKMTSISKIEIDFKNEVYPKDVRQGELWDKLLEQVHTPYVLVAPHISHFNDDIDLKRLVRLLSNNDGVMIAGGSYRNLRGEWDIGCQQDSFRNWTVTYKGGYYYSFSDCVVCDFMPGPWVAKTQALKELKFDASMPYGAFHDLFWRLKRSVTGRVAVSCPDVMFNVITRDVKDEEYASFANKFDIKKWIDTNGRVRWYGCRRGYAHTRTSCSFGRGIGLPPCNMENLADAIKFIMKECEEAGMFCEFQSGTLLGAVKFNSVLPWERDADLTFLTANYSSFKRLQSKLSQGGISMSADDASLWCCADGRQAGGIIHAGANGWSIQMYGQHLMESEILVAQGQRPTKVLFAGQWISTMRNPGLYARNNYGSGLYQHQEHWMDMGHRTGWSFYSPGSFTKCSHPGHSACLDQYPADGNLQFSDYCSQ